MTNLIHIVGTNGVGKTRLALDIIAGLKERGKTAMSLVEEGLQAFGTFDAPSIDDLRTDEYFRNVNRARCDYLMVEHEERPTDLQLQRGDQLITIEAL